MYAWETLNIYSQQDDRFFEPVDRHAPTPEHLAVYRALAPSTWRLRRRGLWYIADPPDVAGLPGQGWKLHVSVRTGEGAAAMHAALPALFERGTHFKFLVDPWAHAFANAKLWPRGSSGKFFTVYPVGDDEFQAVAAALTAALDGFTGPYILSDRRVPGSSAVYYRYGGFIGTPRLRPDGGSDLMITAPDGTLHPDIRYPYWNLPPWITETPFEEEAPPVGDGLLNGRFRVEKALNFTNRGGVYQAADTVTGETVVLKEARPHVRVGTELDVTDLLAKEHRLLTRLADADGYVRPVALFSAWEHVFLAERFVDGTHLGTLSISTNPLYTRRLDPASFAAYHGRMRGLIEQVARAVRAAHQRGIVLADLSFTNVMVDGDDRIHLIDLEGAVETGVDQDTGLFTPGISGAAGEAGDLAALGALLFGSIMLGNAMVGFDPAALPRFLGELHADLGLPDDLVSLITDLTSGVVADADVAVKRIAALTVGDPAAWPEVLPLNRPAAETVDLPRLHRRIDETVAGVLDHVGHHASPHRRDRLFPADLGVYETSAAAVAFGAAGVLRAQHLLGATIPGEHRGWLLENIDDLPPGLFHGAAGVAWALADLGEPAAAAALMRRAAGDPMLWERADVMHGCAGYGLAALHLWRATGDDWYREQAVRVGDHLGTTVDGDHWPDADGSSAIGYGHGASGIALFLLYLGLATGDDRHGALGRRALDFDLAQARTTPEGLTSFPARTGGDTTTLRGYWDHGTAGVLMTLVRYLAVSGDEDLEPWVDRLVPDIARKYAVLPQLFHGLAGVGNVLLDVAEYAGRPDLVVEAARLAEGVLLYGVRRDGGIAFPGEQALRATCDYATGSTGVALFLHRLRHGGGNFNFVVDELLPRRGTR